MNLVSVVIPTCGRSTLLEKAVRSVLAQTYSAIEVLVVDDSPRKEGEEVVKSFSDPRLKYMQNKGHGAGSARNSGVAVSHGALIAFLDDDDTWMPHKLERQVRVFETMPEVLYSFTAVRIQFPKRDHVTTTPTGAADYHVRALSRFSGMLTSTLMLRADAFRMSGGFDERMPSHQEAELMIRVSALGLGFGINEALTIMDSSGHAHIGASLGRRIRGREMLLDKHHGEFVHMPRVYAKHLQEIGFWYRDSGNMRAAHDTLTKALHIAFSPRILLHIAWVWGRSFLK